MFTTIGNCDKSKITSGTPDLWPLEHIYCLFTVNHGHNFLIHEHSKSHILHPIFMEVHQNIHLHQISLKQ